MDHCSEGMQIRVREKKRPQYSRHNFDKFIHSFVIFGRDVNEARLLKDKAKAKVEARGSRQRPRPRTRPK